MTKFQTMPRPRRFCALTLSALVSPRPASRSPISSPDQRIRHRSRPHERLHGGPRPLRGAAPAGLHVDDRVRLHQARVQGGGGGDRRQSSRISKMTPTRTRNISHRRLCAPSVRWTATLKSRRVTLQVKFISLLERRKLTNIRRGLWPPHLSQPVGHRLCDHRHEMEWHPFLACVR